MLHHPTRVVMYGLGSIGTQIAQLILKQPDMELVGGIDVAPDKQGRDLGDVLGYPRALGAVVEADADTVLRRTHPDAVVIATASHLREVFPQVRTCLQAGARVVSTCEELIYPSASHPEVARDLDEAAKRAHAAVLGIGINPGFVMDTLPILLTAPSSDIRHIRVRRVIDASTRRATLQHRIGAGLDPIAFRNMLRQKMAPHVGLVYSLRMIADAVGWQLDRVEEHAEPVIADRWLRTESVTVAPGQVAGIHQTARGYLGGHEMIDLDWQTVVGVEQTFDSITIDGMPPIDVVIRGGIHGDQATAALVVRALSTIMRLSPGLRTVLDLPVLHFTRPYLLQAAVGRH